MLLKTKDLSTLSGAAYAISGIVKGLGIKTIEDFKIFDTLESEANDKNANPLKKVALLNCFEAFSHTLGKSFEIYMERVVPQVLSAFSDNKATVRTAGKDALDCIMLNISGYCVKKLISTIFLHGIEEANWRTKLGQIEALCSMAMFAPNQVAVHLPKVINSIRAILLDTHPKVQEAGQDALNKIISAMRNQGRLNALAILEVHSEQIAKSSATENLQKALDRLLETNFIHSLDDPSLALLMPLIKDGLEAVNRKIQIKALRIIGYI
jgi:citrate lyase gamma subunit